MQPLPEPPRSLLDHASLFLDFDGTLCDFVSPDRDPAFCERRRALVEGLARRLQGRVAIVSGRELDSLERLVSIDRLDMVGSHGLERRTANGARIAPAASFAAIDEVHEQVRDFAASLALIIETKAAGATIHYRGRPEQADVVDQFAARLADDHGLELRRGAMVAEVRAPGPHKGDAVCLLMAEAPFCRGVPLFIGDDITDEDGFAAARALGGVGVLVGPARKTAATYRLSDVDSVMEWLSA